MVGNYISIRGGCCMGLWCGVWDVCGLKTVWEVCLVYVLGCVDMVIGVLWGVLWYVWVHKSVHTCECAGVQASTYACRGQSRSQVSYTIALCSVSWKHDISLNQNSTISARLVLSELFRSLGSYLLNRSHRCTQPCQVLPHLGAVDLNLGPQVSLPAEPPPQPLIAQILKSHWGSLWAAEGCGWNPEDSGSF